MTKLDEIALRVAKQTHATCPCGMQSESAMVDFARALLAELSKDAEPVAWEWVDAENGMQISFNEPPEYPEVFHLRPLFTRPIPANTAEIEQKPKQQWPNHNWCVGCAPDNCSGCGTEPLERRKESKAEIEQRVAEAIAKMLNAEIKSANAVGLNTAGMRLAVGRMELGKWREFL